MDKSKNEQHQAAMEPEAEEDRGNDGKQKGDGDSESVDQAVAEDLATNGWQ